MQDENILEEKNDSQNRVQNNGSIPENPSELNYGENNTYIPDEDDESRDGGQLRPLEEVALEDSDEIKKIIKNRDDFDPGNNMNYNNPLYKDARTCAVKIICRYERSDAYLDKLLDIEFRNNHLLNDFDKSLLNELAHGVVRWLRRLDWFLNGFYRGNYEKCIPEIKNAMRVALYQILFLNKIPYSAAVNEAVEFVKRIHGDKHAGVVNGLLRTIIRTLDSLVWPTREIDEVNYLGIIQSHPNWLVRRWVQRYGFDDTQKLCEANNKRPPITMRYNKLKITEKEFTDYLTSKGLVFSKAHYIDTYYNVKIFSKISEDEFFKKGYFSIQDESAGLVSLLVDPKPNELIFDVCAAPGGKSLHMRELANGKANILAVDKYLLKAENMKKNLDRLGIENIVPVHDDISNPVTEALTNKFIEKFDKVLVDAPCSGLGVLSKKPDIKWKRNSEDILKMQKIQLEILENSIKYLNKKGVLIYSTCTIEPEENIEVIELFLEKHPEFSIDNAERFVNKELISRTGCIETYPHKHNIDGAFAARLIRK
jgi:16S rRNA (cytosine967-C5)-methyltransferase